MGSLRSLPAQSTLVSAASGSTGTTARPGTAANSVSTARSGTAAHSVAPTRSGAATNAVLTDNSVQAAAPTAATASTGPVTVGDRVLPGYLTRVHTPAGVPNQHTAYSSIGALEQQPAAEGTERSD